MHLALLAPIVRSPQHLEHLLAPCMVILKGTEGHGSEPKGKADQKTIRVLSLTVKRAIRRGERLLCARLVAYGTEIRGKQSVCWQVVIQRSVAMVLCL